MLLIVLAIALGRYVVRYVTKTHYDTGAWQMALGREKA